MDTKTLLILVLCFLLLISILGVNILIDLGRFLNMIFEFLKNLFGLAGFSFGNILNTSSNTISNVAKTGIDITNGAVNDVGNLMKGNPSIDTTLNHSNIKPTEPQPSQSQSNNLQWCLVNDTGGKRHCKQIKSNEKCESGKLFPTENQCNNT